MITLKEVRADYYYFSGKLSDIVRQLSFAGIGVVWILRVGKDVSDLKFNAQMVGALSAFCLALTCDLLQYVWSAGLWGFYSRYHEKRGALPEQKLYPSKYLNWPSIGFFWVKVLLCVAGMWTLLHYLGKQF